MKMYQLSLTFLLAMVQYKNLWHEQALYSHRSSTDAGGIHQMNRAIRLKVATKP